MISSGASDASGGLRGVAIGKSVWIERLGYCLDFPLSLLHAPPSSLGRESNLVMFGYYLIFDILNITGLGQF
jgi:hypothetical protein